jgi:hypothetical protein
MRVRIPANTTAVVHVPARDAASVTEGEPTGAGGRGDGQPVAAGDVPGVKVVEAGAGEVILEVGSGEYRFVGR